MIDIPAIFKNKVLDEEKLAGFGFSCDGGTYSKNYMILKNQYRVTVTVTPDGNADFRVYEADTDEEYLLAHIYDAKGAFIGKVHKACEAILADISRNCYHTEYFKCEQSKRILAYIKETYDADPEFLWKSLPECAALRVQGKKPWFAVVGRVGRDKFDLDGGGVVEVINLKNEPKAVTEHIESSKAYPAYHMNKQHLYSVFMDDSLTDAEIIALIVRSFELVDS